MEDKTQHLQTQIDTLRALYTLEKRDRAAADSDLKAQIDRVSNSVVTSNCAAFAHIERVSSALGEFRTATAPGGWARKSPSPSWTKTADTPVTKIDSTSPGVERLDDGDDQ